jgi:hypothetical protein
MRARPSCEPLEPREHPDAGLGLLAAAWGVYNSPVVVAARAAALGYQVGQHAWTGHTKLLFGTVHVTQSYPLDQLAGPQHTPSAVGNAYRLHQPAAPPAPFLRITVARLGTFTTGPLAWPKSRL